MLVQNFWSQGPAGPNDMVWVVSNGFIFPVVHDLFVSKEAPLILVESFFVEVLSEVLRSCILMLGDLPFRS